MPIEVISLLSSSPASTNLLPARRHDDADPGSARFPKHSNHHGGPEPTTTTKSRPANRSEAIPDVVFCSDDFDTTWDRDDPGDVYRDLAPKRPRLSEEHTSPRARPKSLENSQPAATATEKPQLLQTAAPRRVNSAPEPIELSSSPIHQPDDPKPTFVPYDANIFSSSSPAQPRIMQPKSVGSAVSVAERNPFVSSSPVARIPPARTAVEWDPISSSAPHPPRYEPASRAPLQRSQSEVILLNDSGDEAGQASSGEEFPDIDSLRTAPRRPFAATQSKVIKRSKPSAAKPADGRTKDKAARAVEREAEKERKQREKERARQEKAAEKQRAAALAEVNKVRTDKKISTPEMIVDLPATLSETVRLQAETLLQDLDVQSSSYASPVDNVVKWRRKVRARYNEEMGLWEPIPQVIEPEKYAMVVLPAASFVKLALGEDGQGVEAHAVSMRQYFSDHTFLYLIEGMMPWMRSNRNIRNRQFVSAVRGGLEDESSLPPSSQAPVRRRRNNAAQPGYIDENLIEDALLELQVVHGALIHHTNVAVETAQWIAIFTQHISTVPYRRQREETNAAAAAFCMETGQVRTGDGPKDTYVRMMQEIVRVTAPIAYGIAAEFDTVSNLVKGLEDGGSLALESVRKSANKDGAVSDRTVGQAVSRRLHKIFTGRDELSMDI